MMNKCSHGDGVTVEVGGIPVDPCVYKEVETHHNCTVHVMKCVNCGHVEIEWEKEPKIVHCKDCVFWGTTLSPSDKEEARQSDDADLVCDMWEEDGFTPHDYCSRGRRCGY